MARRPKLNHWQLAHDSVDSMLKGHERRDELVSSALYIPPAGRDAESVITSVSTRVTPAEVRQRRHLAMATAAATETGSLTSGVTAEPERPILTTASITAQRIASHAKGKAPATLTSDGNAAIINADSFKEERPVQGGAEMNSKSKRLNGCQVYSPENEPAVRTPLAEEMASLRDVIQKTRNTTPRTGSSMPQHLEESLTQQIQCCIERLDALQQDMGLEHESMTIMRARILLISQCLDRLETHANETQLHTDKMGEFILQSTNLIKKRLDTVDKHGVRYDESLELLNRQISPFRELIECLTQSHVSVLRQLDLINQKLIQLGHFPQQEVQESQEQDGGDVECDTRASNRDSDTSDFVVVSDDEGLSRVLFP